MPRTLRILVVDDNRDSADVLGEVLRDEGFNVCVAYSGKQAVEEAAAFRPDVAIIDLVMPDTDGFETVQALQRQPSSQGMTYVAYTGVHVPEVMARCQRLGIHHFILKPASIATIEDVLHSVISQRTGPVLPAHSGIVATNAAAARRYVVRAENAVAAQRTRLERLRSSGLQTSDAERLLAIFQNVVVVMRKRLAVAESF